MPASLAIRAALLFVAITASAPAAAQVFRAYLAAEGNDSNPCTLVAPCRLLPRALSVVADGGEIWMLDSANYNAATVAVTKSVTVMAVPGVVGSVVATGGPAVSIATAGVKVALRNIVVTALPSGGGTSGVQVSNGARVTIDGSRFSNLPQSCVFVDASTDVVITNTSFDGCGSDGITFRGAGRLVADRVVVSGVSQHGIAIAASGASVLQAAISNSVVTGSGSQNIVVAGNGATAAVDVSISNCNLSFTFDSGIAVFINTVGALVRVAAHNNTISNHVVGTKASGAGANVSVSGNTITRSTIGIQVLSSNVETSSTNVLRENASDVIGVLVPVAMK